MVKRSGGAGRYFARKCRSWGLPLLFLRFLSKIKGRVTKLKSALLGGEWQTQELVKFKMLVTSGRAAQGIFFPVEGSGVVLKDKDH